jgi:hypothetical protein
MSASGTLFLVEDSDRTIFSACSSRSDWYSALGVIEKRGELQSTFIGDSVDAWRELLERHPGSLHRLFFGEFSSVDDSNGSGDPHMFFAGSCVVSAAAAELSQPTDVLLRDSFDLDANSVHPGLRESIPVIREFLLLASGKSRAVVGLWG